MSWNDLDPEHQKHLEATLTRKQLDVCKLHLAGMGSRRMSDIFGVSRSTVKDHLRTVRNALATLDRKDAA